jgi:hypothetical protein
MTAKSILVAAAAVSFATTFATQASAQSMSTLTHAKRAASNAVAATNEHTAREQMVGSVASETKPAAATSSAAKPTHDSAAASAPAKRSGTATRAASSAPKAAATAVSGAHANDAPANDAPAKATRPSGSAKTAAKPGDTPEKGQTQEITLMRESFTYEAGGRRDPFVSLIANGDLRPMISDLRLVTVIYAPQGRSVAVMRDVSTDEQYRVTAGQTLGRMRVASISPKAVTFTIEEYGFSRQEVLALNDTTKARSQ